MLVRMSMCATIVENSIEVPQKIKNWITIWFSKPTSGFWSKGIKIRLSKRYFHSHICCSIIHNNWYREAAQMSVDVSMDRYMIYTYHGVFCVCVCVCVCVCILSHSVVSDSLRPHGLQLTRPPCPSLSPRVFSNSCPLSQWCHPTISPSAAPFYSCPQSFIPSVRVFSNEPALCIRWPGYWSQIEHQSFQ